jgi:hypothetical protein
LDEPGSPRTHSPPSCDVSLYLFKLAVYRQFGEGSDMK